MKKLVLITSTAVTLCFAIVACKKDDTITERKPMVSWVYPELKPYLPLSFDRGIMGVNPFEPCIQGNGVCKMNVRSTSLSISGVLVSDHDSAVIRIPISYYNAYVKDFAGDSIKISSEVLLDSATAYELIGGDNPQWKLRPLPTYGYVQGYPIIRKCVSGYNGYNITCAPAYYGITFHKDSKGAVTDVDIHL